jgi:hypothetical protein
MSVLKFSIALVSFAGIEFLPVIHEYVTGKNEKPPLHLRLASWIIAAAACVVAINDIPQLWSIIDGVLGIQIKPEISWVPLGLFLLLGLICGAWEYKTNAISDVVYLEFLFFMHFIVAFPFARDTIISPDRLVPQFVFSFLSYLSLLGAPPFSSGAVDLIFYVWLVLLAFLSLFVTSSLSMILKIALRNK